MLWSTSKVSVIGEFNNDVFKDMNQKFGIETSITSGKSPFCNGMIEWNNRALYEITMMMMMMMTMDDAKSNRNNIGKGKNVTKTFGNSPNEMVGK